MRNTVIDNLRGVCMLGVLAIHAGSLALQPNNFYLYVLLEVLSRYSVPAFFFISGYGLVCRDLFLTGHEAKDTFSYRHFLCRRLSAIGIPYIFWSVFYLLYFKITMWEHVQLSWGGAAHALLFGTACYHLYFMVILICFYLSYPWWRQLVKLGRKNTASVIIGCLVAQLLFNWWTTHTAVDVSGWPQLFRNLFLLRLNYLPLHYGFVFVLGGLSAVFWRNLQEKLTDRKLQVILFFAVATLWDVWSCLHAYKYEGYDLLALANTFHQLSPQGLIYTVAAILFFCMSLILVEKRSAGGRSVPKYSLNFFAANATLVYFIHPLILDWLQRYYSYAGIVMTVKKVCFSYLALLAASVLFSVLLGKFTSANATLKLLLTGKKT